MGRRRFEHLLVELSLAVAWVVPRYALWLRLHEEGLNPEALTREDALAFCDGPLQGFLAEYGIEIPPRVLRRLRRTVRRFDPEIPTPYERATESG